MSVSCDVSVPDVALLSLTLAFGILLRLPLHVLLPMRFEAGLSGGDISGVVTKIYQLTRHKWLHYVVPDSVIPGKFAYPIFFHWLISKCPRSRWREVSVVLNLIPDLIAATAVFYVLRYLLIDDCDDGLVLSLFGSLLLLTMPILLPVTSRMKSTNGRAFGFLVVNLALLSMVLGIHNGYFPWFFVAVALGLVTVLSSMFATQVLVFFAVPLSAFYLTVMPVLVVIAVFVIAFAIPQLGAKDVLEFKFAHFLWYHRNKDNIAGTVKARSLFGSVIEFFTELRRSSPRVKTILLSSAPLLIATYSMPLVFVLLYAIWVVGWEASTANAVMFYCLALLAAAGLVFLLTATRWFVEWGQAERYFEYTAPMLVVATVWLGWRYELFGPVTLMSILLIQLSTLLLIHLYDAIPVMRLTRQYPSEKWEREVVDFIQGLQRPTRVTALPQQMQRYWPRFFRDSCSNEVESFYTFILESGKSATDGFLYMDQVFKSHNQIPSITPQEMHQRYGIEFVIALRRFADANTKWEYVRSLREHAIIVFENEKYVVFSINVSQAEKPASPDE